MKYRRALIVAVALTACCVGFIAAPILYALWERPPQRVLDVAGYVAPSLLDTLTVRTTQRYVVELTEDQDPLLIAVEHDYRYIGPLTGLPGMHVFELPPRGRRADVPTLEEAVEEGKIAWVEQQVERRRFTRSTGSSVRRRGSVPAPPTDPLYTQQWHLAAASIQGAWAQGVTGRGVLISIVDDGLAHAHPDLTSRYVATASRDVNARASDPLPRNGDSHGTSCGGVAAGTANNGACGVGAAPEAFLAGIRLIGAPATDADEAEALVYGLTVSGQQVGQKTVDIYSSSWGPSDDGRRLEGPQRLTQLAIERGIREGRAGRGAIYVVACGNGKTSQDRTDYDGYASSRYVVAVGALGKHGSYPYYSEPGSAVLVVAPSSDGIDAISTCRAPTGCTTSFGGTSAAAPLVAGIIALLLEKRPDLGWRDVKRLLVETSDRVDPSYPDWQRSTMTGRYTSAQYGYGAINASRLIAAASTYQLLPRLERVWNATTPTTPTTSTNTLSVLQDGIVEHVEIDVELRVSSRAALSITLTAPSGTRSVLMQPHRDTAANLKWRFTSVRHYGEKSKGVWRLDVTSTSASTPISSLKWGLTFYGV